MGCIIFITIILLDWLSFLQTYFCMKIASVSAFPIIVFVGYADIILSINIFLFIFPISIIVLTSGTCPNHSILSLRYDFFQLRIKIGVNI
jgi:hypothetical protein